MVTVEKNIRGTVEKYATVEGRQLIKTGDS